MCRTAITLRLESLKNTSRVVQTVAYVNKNPCQFFHKNGILNNEILNKYGVSPFTRKKNSFVILKNRKCRLAWSHGRSWSVARYCFFPMNVTLGCIVDTKHLICGESVQIQTIQCIFSEV